MNILSNPGPHRACVAALAALISLPAAGPLRAQTPEESARRLQVHFRSIKTLSATFRQVYESGPVRQEETGSLWLRKPGRMRWEYRDPETKLFVVDGRNAYFFVPSDNQVSVRPLTSEDLQDTPLGFLVADGDLLRDFQISEAAPTLTAAEDVRALHLAPRRPLENVAAMVVEFDARSLTIRRLTVHDYSGGANRIDLAAWQENTRLSDDLFRFRIPRGVEVLRAQEPRQ